MLHHLEENNAIIQWVSKLINNVSVKSGVISKHMCFLVFALLMPQQAQSTLHHTHTSKPMQILKCFCIKGNAICMELIAKAPAAGEVDLGCTNVGAVEHNHGTKPSDCGMHWCNPCILTQQFPAPLCHGYSLSRLIWLPWHGLSVHELPSQEHAHHYGGQHDEEEGQIQP